MAKKQSRRSVSLSRTTYERLRMYCETNQVSMSQFVEGRIGDFLGKPAGAPAVKRPEVVPVAAPAPAPVAVAAPAPAPRPTPAPAPAPVAVAPSVPRPAPVVPTPAPAPVRVVQSAPNPGQKPMPAKPVKLDEAAAKRAADRIFTF
jgi:hypothetical protein